MLKEFSGKKGRRGGGFASPWGGCPAAGEPGTPPKRMSEREDAAADPGRTVSAEGPAEERSADEASSHAASYARSDSASSPRAEPEETKPAGPRPASFAVTDLEAREAAKAAASGMIDHPDPRAALSDNCLLYTSPSPRDATLSRMPSSA